MDEVALRAMMPMSFGKRPVKKDAKPAPAPATPTTQTEASSSTTTATSSALSASVLGKRPATDSTAEAEEEEEDDGLTAEERAANREADRIARERRAQGLDSDSDDSDPDSDSSDDEIGPPPPPSATTASTRSAFSHIALPPMTKTTTLQGTHNKTLSALAVDPSGSRFALGSYDYNLSLYDFGGMSSSFSPFRLFEPAGSYPVLDLSFSANGSNLLVISGTSEAKVFSRDGGEVGTCKKGDPYLRDMRNTVGHVSGLTFGQWDSSDLGRFYTGGSDSTVRVWDVESMAQGQTDVIVVKSKARRGRTKVTALSVKDSTLLASGHDGSLSFWDLRSNLNSKPRGAVDKAHEAETTTSSIAVSQNGHTVATRGGDGTVKLWDLRKFKSPLAIRDGLINTSAHTSVIFDPMNSNSVVTCVSATPVHKGATTGIQDDSEITEKDMRGGAIVVLDNTHLELVKSYPVTSSPIRLHWSQTTDELFTTSRDGTLSIHHTPGRSTKGILLPLSRAPKTSSSSLYTSANPSSMEDSYPIFEGNTTDLSQNLSESAKRRRLEKARQDPLKTRIPQKPIDGVGKGGRIGASAMTGVVQSMFGTPQDIGEDPREALLKYANKSGDRGDEIE